jgi:hypothetical protein
MTWLLRLYPAGWRRRYGAELSELIAAQSFSIGSAIDLLAGAVDAWLHPELIRPIDPDSKGEAMMVARMMQPKCAGCGPDISASDKRKSAAVNIGGTLVLILPWLWAVRQFHGNGYVMALAPMTYILPNLLGQRYTSLNGRSGRVQAVLITGLGASLFAFLLVVGWICAKI